jgi:hypothetical protein
MNYSNGKIYKIISNQTNEIYIGSTTKKYLCDRFASHTYHYRQWKNNLFNYLTSFEILQYADAKIILIETFPCKSKDELLAREQYWIDNIPNAINNRAAFQSIQQRKEQKKLWDTNNTCICGGKYKRKHKNPHLETTKHQNYIDQVQWEEIVLMNEIAKKKYADFLTKYKIINF